MRFLPTVFTGAVLLLVVSAGAGAQVRVWQGTIALPTYEEDLPDPNPPFDQLASTRFNYPYTLRTHLTNRRTDHVWRAVFLENEYLKCSVLPDLGGHLYTCIDKINGQSMFYANPSIKKANVGYRGAWAAFGIEFNFPVSHNWVSLSPVEFVFGQDPDGAASVTVGNVDRVYGMEWTVELRLRPGSSLLEERVVLSNRSDVRHRFYWWNNAAVQVWDDSHIEYPMSFAASHGFTEVEPWPVDQHGHDLSTIRNQIHGPVSLFVHGSREPFMGIWNPHTKSGTVHFSYYAELPGKKIWSWGADSDGLDWRKTLSDNNSAYVEVQAGLFRNQETYSFLEPRQRIAFSEYWMPVREIGGITRANLSGVLSLKTQDRDLLVGFNANQAFPDASILVLENGTTVVNVRKDLAPERTFLRSVKLADRSTKYIVEVRDRTGRLLMRQVRDEYDWTPASEISIGARQKYRFPDASKRSEDDWIRFGIEQELNGQLLLARETYQQALRLFPDSYSVLKAEGRLAVSLLDYKDGIYCLERVHERQTTDAEAAYYLGLAYDGEGKSRAARQTLEAAYRSPTWRAAAALRLAELSARENDLAEAEHYLEQASKSVPDDARAAEEFIAVESALGKNHEASAKAKALLVRFPLSTLLRHGASMQQAGALASDDHRLLRLAGEYMRLGLYGPALDVLSRPYPESASDETEPGEPEPERDPLVGYFRAYCKKMMGKVFEEDSLKASHLPPTYVFPSGEEELIVLRSAVGAHSGDANAHYLLGTLLFSIGKTEEALAEWREAKKSVSAFPVLDASMGRALLYAKDDAAGALSVFLEGIRNDPENPAVYQGADQSLSILGRSAGERAQVFDSYPEPGRMPPDLVFERAMALAEMEQFDRATALFRDRFFPREEGGTNVRQVWVEIQLERALFLAKHGRCGAAASVVSRLGEPVEGLSFTSDGLEAFVHTPRVNYWLGKMEVQCGASQAAEEHFVHAAAATGSAGTAWAWLGAKELPGFDESAWIPRLKQALGESRSMAQSGAFAGWWVYNEGLLSLCLGQSSEAEASFRKVFFLPDRLLSYHLARQAAARR
ncbi:MAG: DUF5107 domain-containing protein [Acidobacteria bacterium]|nr:DUF5107 domain-containing protein [Acidobacteriota bacterium]